MYWEGCWRSRAAVSRSDRCYPQKHFRDQYQKGVSATQDILTFFIVDSVRLNIIVLYSDYTAFRKPDARAILEQNIEVSNASFQV